MPPLSDAKRFGTYVRPAIPAAKALRAAWEFSSGQSIPESYLSNQTKALIWGYAAGSSAVSRSVIQPAFEPRRLVDLIRQVLKS